MGKKLKLSDFGVADYPEILDLQKKLFSNLIEEKRTYGKGISEFLLIGEHTPVITLGRKAHEENIIVNKDFLSSLHINVFKIQRGGDVTFHNPGQLIAYPIIDLEKHHLGVKDFVNLLEETIISLLDKYSIKGEKIEGATGVWIGKGTKDERKICAIGIKCTRFCTMHGLALNVRNDLQGFSLINPCGFIDKGVTSMEQEIGYPPDMEKVKKEFSDIFFSLIFPLKKVFHFSE